MSRSVIFFLISLLSVSLLSAKTPEDINLGSEITTVITKEPSAEATYYYSVKFDQPLEKYSYVQIEATTVKKTSAYMYLSKTAQNPSRKDYDLLSYSNTTHRIYLPLTLVEKSRHFYLAVDCKDFRSSTQKTCGYTLNFTLTQLMIIPKGEVYSLVAQPPFLQFNVSIPIGKQGGYSNVFVTGSQREDVNATKISIEQGPLSDTKLGGPEFQKSIVDLLIGDIILASEKDIEEIPKNDFYYMIKVEAAENTFISIGSRRVDQVNTIEPNDRALYGALDKTLEDKDITEKQCFKIEDNDSTDSSLRYLVSVFCGSGKVSAYLSSEDMTKKDEKLLVEEEDQDVFVVNSNEFSTFPYVCVKTEADKSSFSLQVTRFTDYVAEPNIEPLVNGIHYTFRNAKNEIKYFRHFKHQRGTNDTSFLVVKQTGNINTFVYHCTDFPDCVVREKDLSKEGFINITDVAGTFSYLVQGDTETNLLDDEQYLLVVQCLDKVDCEYLVAFADENDILLLNDKRPYAYQPMLKGSVDKYKIKLDKGQIEDGTVTIILKTITGDSSMEVTSAEGVQCVTTYSGNTEIAEFNYAIIVPSEINTYFVTIKGDKGNFYSISFHVLSIKHKEVQLPSGIASLETLNPTTEYNEKVYTINDVEVGKTFVTTIYPLNCEIEVKDLKSGRSVYKHKDGYYQIEEENPDNVFLKYEVKFKEMPSSSDPTYERCLYYIGGVKMNDDEELVVNEGVPLLFSLNSKVKKARFIYPNPPIGGRVAATFNIETESNLQVQVFFGSDRLDKTFNFFHSRSIVITESEIKNLCSTDQFCNLIFEVTDTDPTELVGEEDVTFQVIIKSEAEIPAYLIKNQIREDVVFPLTYQYFVYDITKNEEGQININFNRGAGRIYAKLVPKDKVEDKPNWNGRVHLPKKNSKDLLEYDPFAKTIKYTSKDTSICNTGCEMYVGVVTEESYAPGLNKVFYREFSIYARKYEPKRKDVVDIPVNEYIIGSLDKVIAGETGFDYFRVNIPNHIEEYYIEIQCETCDVYVKNGEEPPIETTADKKCTADGKDRVCTVTEGLGRKDLIQTIGIGTRKISEVYTTPYQIRILSPIYTEEDDGKFKKRPYLMPISADQGTLCDAKISYGTSGSYCYYVLPLTEYDDMSNLFIYTFSTSGNDLKVYVNIFDRDTYENFDDDQLLKNLPTKEASQYTTEHQVNKDYFLLSWSSLKAETYIVIGVEKSKISGTVTVLTSFITYVYEMSANPSTTQAFNIDSGNHLTLNIPNNRDYLVHVVSVDGTGRIEVKGDEDVEIRGARDSYATVFKKGHKKDIRIASPDKLPFNFYFWYSVRSSKNFDEVEYGTTGEYFYKTNFPISFFTKLESGEECVFNINFYRTEKSLKISALVISEEEFYKAKNEGKEIEIKTSIQSMYDQTVQTGQVIVKEEDIAAAGGINKYLYVKVVDTEEKNEEEEIHIEVSVLPLVPKDLNTILPVDQYFASILKNGEKSLNIYRLKKNQESHNWFRFQFSTNSPDLDFSFASQEKDLINEKVYKNSTVFKEKIEDVKGGRRSIDFQTGFGGNEIYVAVFNKTGEHSIFNQDLARFSLRYVTSESNETFPNLRVENEEVVVGERSESKIILEVEQIKNGDTVEPSRYYPRVIEKNESNKIEDFSTITMIEGISKFDYKTSTDEKKNKTKIEIEGINNSKEYFITVIGITNKDFDMFAYKTIEITKGQNRQTLLTTILVVLVSIVVVGIIVGIIVLFWNVKKKNVDLKAKVEHTSFAGEGKEPLVGNEVGP